MSSKNQKNTGLENSRMLAERFEFRDIRPEEGDQAAQIELICFPPNEACTEAMMKERAEKVSDLFFVAADRSTGKIAGFLNGIATDEGAFRDELTRDLVSSLHQPDGKHVMLLGLDVLPEYRGTGACPGNYAPVSGTGAGKRKDSSSTDLSGRKDRDV